MSEPQTNRSSGEPTQERISDQAQPKQVGPYEILGLLGSGGMGRVYRAHDPRLNRDVAVKMLPQEFSSNPQRRTRFEQEAKAVAALNHPGIVAVYDVGDGWMVTELVEGRNLRQTGLSVTQVIDIGAQIADALAVAHEAGISHRDLKPENVMLTPDGRTKILDFGLAKVVDPAKAAQLNGDTPAKPEDASTLTNPGIPFGSPGYMSPEQVRGQTTDHRSDMFSLGVMLYELLSGHPVFKADSAIDVMHAIVHEDPPELPDSVPDGLQRILKRCLEKKPAQRFQSARDLSFALRSLSAGNITHVPKSNVVPAQPAASGKGFLWAGVALACLLVGALTARFLPSQQVSTLANYEFHPFSFSSDQEHSGVWSPDGKSIAFLRQTPEGTHLMLQSLDAPEATQLAAQVSPQPGQLAWAPDGTKVYFLGNGGRGGGVQEVSTAGGFPTQVLRGNFGRGPKQDGGNPNPDAKQPELIGPDGKQSDSKTNDKFGPDGPAANFRDNNRGRDAKAFPGGGDLKQFDKAGPPDGKGRGKQFGNSFAAPTKAELTSKQNGSGNGPGGPGGPGGPPPSTTSAFDVSRDGQSLAIWRATSSGNGTSGNGTSGNGTSGNGNGEDAAGTRYSVWISSPIGSEPKEYLPAPFTVRTVFTPVFLRFSPNGKLLFLSMYTNTGAETWLLPVPIGSGEPHRIFADVAWNKPVAASWMPDSRRMVLSGNPVPATGEQLWMADVIAETRTQMLATPQNGYGTPSVSPDGRRILFARMERDRDIVALPLDGSAPTTILATSLQEFGPSWSPEGDQFAYVTRRNGNDELWVRSPEGNWDRPVVTAKEFPSLQSLVSPVFSPDGARIAYTALLAGGGRRRSLAISPSSGGKPTVIADGFAPTWAPNTGGAFSGAFISFLWLKPDGTLPIAMMPVGISDRPPQELIPATPGLGAPEWSPSGEWIAAASSRGVELTSPRAGFRPGGPGGRGGPPPGAQPDAPTTRTIPGLNGAALAWSKDSKTLYGLTFQSQKPTLSSMDIATGVVKQIAEYDLNFQPLLENNYTGSIRLSMSPDGKSVATATAKNQADLWILDGFDK